MKRNASILFPVGIPEPFDYAVPDDLPGGARLSVGDFVYAPLGKQMKLGVVWALKAGDDSERKLKPIAEVKRCRGLTPLW